MSALGASSGDPDPVLMDDWHPVALAAGIPPGSTMAVRLLDQDFVLWREAGGLLTAWEDRCPHRGMKLSMGLLEDRGLVCPYHGWIFGHDGRCAHVPAHPGVPADALKARVRTVAVQERYGLVWVCPGTPIRDVPPFPEFADERLRKVWCGPYDVAAGAPRIIENFLDMGHFGFVHGGILGDSAHAAVPDYTVDRFSDAVYGEGVWARQCRAWQPRSNARSEDGSMVSYTYRVVRPLTAILTKQPDAMVDFHEAISLHLQPVSETSTRAWIILAMTNFESSDEELRHFQDTIFLQDLPIVENQRPLKLPLVPGAEVSMPCDRMSLAYRRYLTELGLRYGVICA